MVAVIEDEVAVMLGRGRAKLAALRSREASEAEARERAEREEKDMLFAPVRAAAQRLLPACWLSHLDDRREDFRGYNDHTMRVELPGLVPILVGFGGWQGKWEFGTTPLRVARYVRWHDDERGEYQVGVAAQADWLHAADPEVAAAMAEEEAGKRAAVEEECAAENRSRAERAAARGTNSPPTTDEKLVSALRAFVRDLLPAE